MSTEVQISSLVLTIKLSIVQCIQIISIKKSDQVLITLELANVLSLLSLQLILEVFFYAALHGSLGKRVLSLLSDQHNTVPQFLIQVLYDVHE